MDDGNEIKMVSEEALDQEIDQALETLGIFVVDEVKNKDVGPGQG